jgi:hypothetical protein
MAKPNTIFRNSAEAVEHAAHNVAEFWLKSAERIVARQECPAKLSGLGGKQLCLGEMDREIYRGIRVLSSEAIQFRAVEIARGRLALGEFPTVRAFFKGVEHSAQYGKVKSN